MKVSLSNILIYIRMTEEETDKPIACVVVPVYGDKVEVQWIFNSSPKKERKKIVKERYKRIHRLNQIIFLLLKLDSSCH